MEFAASSIALAFSAVLLLGWIAILSAPVALVAMTLVSLPVVAATVFGRFLSRSVDEPERRILAINGFLEPGAATQLRVGVTRVLALAPEGTRPRACVCARRAHDGTYVGVLRVFNRKGHFLRRLVGSTETTVAQLISRELERFKAFPAKIGATRPRCAECDSSLCPLRLLAKRRTQPATG